jgi:hypothetical protein
MQEQHTYCLATNNQLTDRTNQTRNQRTGSLDGKLVLIGILAFPQSEFSLTSLVQESTVTHVRVCNGLAVLIPMVPEYFSVCSQGDDCDAIDKNLKASTGLAYDSSAVRGRFSHVDGKARRSNSATLFSNVHSIRCMPFRQDLGR